MGKLTSYLLGLTAAILLVYYLLYISYLPLINWLGPIIGSDIVFPFGFLFLLLGSSISYPVVLLSWVIIGVVVAVGSRKGTRAIGAAIGIYFTIWSFFVLSLLSLAQKMTGGSFFGTGGTGSTLSMPPIPPGTSISAILSAPIINSVSSLFTSIPGLSSTLGSTGGAISTSSMITSFSTYFYSTLLPAMIINIAVLMVVSGVVGTLLYRAIHKPGTTGNSGDGGNSEKKSAKRVKVKKVKTKKVVRRVRSSNTIVPLAILTVLVASIMLISTVSGFQQDTATTVKNNFVTNTPNSLLNSSLAAGNYVFSSATQSANTTGNLTLTNMSLNYGGGYVGKYGNVYNIYAFLRESSQQPPSFFGTSGSTTPILSAVFASSNLESIFNSLKLDGFLSPSTVDTLQSNQLYNVIPQALILEVYSGNVNTTSSAAMSAARTLSTSMGGTTPAVFLSLNLPISNTTNDVVSLFAYSISIADLTSEAAAANALSPYFYEDGMLPAFTSGLNNGYLIPGETTGSVDGSIFLAGHMDLSALPASLGNITNFVTNASSTSVSGNIYFMGGLFVKQNVIHSSSSNHNITGDQVFNYNQKITFGSNQSIYAVSILYPNQNLTTGTPFTDYNMVIYSNFQNFTGFGNASNITYNYIPSGSGFYFSSVSFPTNVTFPADILVSQSVTHISGNSYRVSIKLINNDTDTMDNVQVNAAPVLGSYGSYASVLGGSTKSSTTSLQPGQSVTVGYNLTLKGIGTYIVATPVFNYTMGNSSFSVLGNTLTANPQNPSVFQAFNQVQYASFSSISSFLHFNYFVKEIVPGLYVFDLIIFLIVVLDVYIEYRAFRRWRKKSSNQTEPPSGEVPEQDEDSDMTDNDQES